MANPFKTPKFLDVEVDQPARFAVFIAHNRLGGDQVAQPRQPGAAQHPADGGGRNPGLLRYMPPAEALAAERDDPPRQRLCGLGRDHPWPGGAVQHALPPLGSETVGPAANDLGRHPVFPRRLGFGKAACDDRKCHLLSTNGRETGILVDVHSGRSWKSVVW